jgi:hypothetical protein
LPVVTSVLVDALRSGNWPARWAAGLLLFVHCLASLGFYPGPIAAIALSSPGSPHGLGRKLAASMLVISALLVSPLGWYTIALVVILAGLLAAAPFVRRDATVLVCVVVSLLFLQRNMSKGQQTWSGEKRDLYDAQRWANRNTASSATFILEPNLPWRVIADRPVIQAYPPPLHVYSRSSVAYERATRTAETLRRHPLTDDAALRAFTREFGGDYLVRSAERPPLARAVYRNQSYAIYALHP